jgi:hypothetical protein
MKRFLVALTIMIGSVFVFMFEGFSNIESKFDYVPPITKVYVYNAEMGLIRFAETEEEIPQYMKAQMDLLCEIDSVKYYLVN